MNEFHTIVPLKIFKISEHLSNLMWKFFKQLHLREKHNYNVVLLIL